MCFCVHVPSRLICQPGREVKKLLNMFRPQFFLKIIAPYEVLAAIKIYMSLAKHTVTANYLLTSRKKSVLLCTLYSVEHNLSKPSPKTFSSMNHI